MTLTRSASEIADYFELERMHELRAANGAALRPRYNIAPSQEIATIVAKHEEADRRNQESGRGFASPQRRLEWKRWGLVPTWARDPAIGGRLFNARSESVSSKPSFRSAFRHRRCLVVADGFYEWTPRNRGHEAFYFEPTAGLFLAFAGLFESWLGEAGEVIESCTILTTQANADVSELHHRMPVWIEPAQQDFWLNEASGKDDLESLLRTAPAGRLKKRPVGPHVNDARRDDPACLEDRPPPPQPSLFKLDPESSV